LRPVGGDDPTHLQERDRRDSIRKRDTRCCFDHVIIRFDVIRVELEERERQTLSFAAAFSAASRGRLRAEAEDPIRPAFQRDRDRIVHSKAFRRLKHKTQVFLAPTGDHYRTRLTHTLEVSQIARTIAKVLCLNEDLTEAIALGHDLGHTPFGHAGERVLRGLMPGGFNHYEQSLRVVDVLEQDGAGLNLTWEVRNGIAKHSKGRDGSPVGVEPAARAETLEGQIARVADIIAYVNHDIDDAVRAGILDLKTLPSGPVAVLGDTSSTRIGRMVVDVVKQTIVEGDHPEIRMSEDVLRATLDLRAFLFDSVYENDIATAEFAKAWGILEGLWEKVRETPERFLERRTLERDGVDVAARDFLAGMTDRYAISLFEDLFIPRPWSRSTINAT
jgi:dGTPase